MHGITCIALFKQPVYKLLLPPCLPNPRGPSSCSWGTGFMFETTTKTLFVGDLFVQHGTAPEPLRDATDLGELK